MNAYNFTTKAVNHIVSTFAVIPFFAIYYLSQGDFSSWANYWTGIFTDMQTHAYAFWGYLLLYIATAIFTVGFLGVWNEERESRALIEKTFKKRK